MQTEFDKEDQETDHSAPHHSHAHHSHQHEQSDPPPASILIQYMLEHNAHHAEELHTLAHRLEEAGCTAAAEATECALELYRQGNAALGQALAALPPDDE